MELIYETCFTKSMNDVTYCQSYVTVPGIKRSTFVK
jgi:hypothetical protein